MCLYIHDLVENSLFIHLLISFQLMKLKLVKRKIGEFLDAGNSDGSDS